MVDLSKLTIDRLKAFRKSLIRKVAGYETCDCGDSGCDYRMEQNKDNPTYLETKKELERVNEALAKKQRNIKALEDEKNWAHVHTIAEWKRHHHPPRREWRKKRI